MADNNRENPKYLPNFFNDDSPSLLQDNVTADENAANLPPWPTYQNPVQDIGQRLVHPHQTLAATHCHVNEKQALINDVRIPIQEVRRRFFYPQYLNCSIPNPTQEVSQTLVHATRQTTFANPWPPEGVVSGNQNLLQDFGIGAVENPIVLKDSDIGNEAAANPPNWRTHQHVNIDNNPSFSNLGTSFDLAPPLPKENITHAAAGNTLSERGFRVTVKRAGKLKEAIEALYDPNLNPRELAMITLRKDCFGLTVHNTTSGVKANLKLDVLESSCSESSLLKMLVSGFLKGASEQLSKDGVGYEDHVTISHVYGSQQIVFTFGRTSAGTGVPVRLIKATPEFRKPPTDGPILGCKALLSVEELKKKMIPFLVSTHQDGSPELVTVTMMPNNLIVGVQKNMMTMAAYTDVLSSNKHQSIFSFPHGSSLEKASNLPENKRFSMGFVNNPPEGIILQFNLEDVGNFFYWQRSSKNTFNISVPE